MEKASIFFKTFLFHHNRRSINATATAKVAEQIGQTNFQAQVVATHMG